MMSQRVVERFQGSKLICCPYNVPQIGNGDRWVAVMPDRSAVYYNDGIFEALNVSGDAWEFMHQVMSV